MSNYKILFKNRNFFTLWLGQLVSALGDRFTQMSLLTLVMVMAQDTGEKMAWITFYSLLPFFLFGQLFGVIGDRANRKKIMIIADFTRAGLVALIPLLNRYAGSIVYLYIIVFLVGTLSALFSPAKMAIIPNVVAKERLIGANSLIASTGMISTLVGTLIAGLLIKLVGPYPIFLIDALTFFISGIMISRIAISTTSVSKRRISRREIFQGIREGLRFINRHQLVLRIVQLNAVFAFLSSFFYIVILNYSTTVLGLSSLGYGVLLTCLGLGLCSGALLLGKKIGKLNFNRILLAGFFLVALMNLLFFLRPNFLFSVLLLIAGGAGASLVMVTLDSLLQRSTPNSLRANVFGARGIVSNFIFLVSLIAVGKLLKIMGAVYLFGFLGLVSFTTAVIIWLSGIPLGYRITKGILRILLRLLFRLKVEGLENLPSHGKVILAGNHTSLLDGVVVMAAYPRQVYFLVAESIFERKFWGFMARQMGFIPISRGGFNKESIREAIRILESRSTIGIFPEGRISPSGELLEGRKGVALIARKTNSLVIPFAIEGAYYAWPVPKKYPRRHPVQIRFGEPIDVREYEVSQELTDEVMDEIKDIKVEMETEGLLEVEPNVIVRHLINFG